MVIALTQYCSEKARNAGVHLKDDKAIMTVAENGSDHQVINELNGESREPNEVFKRLGRAIRYNFQVDDAKFGYQ